MYKIEKKNNEKLFTAIIALKKICDNVDKDTWCKSQKYINVRKEGTYSVIEATDSKRALQIFIDWSDIKEGIYEVLKSDSKTLNLVLHDNSSYDKYPDINRCVNSSKDRLTKIICSMECACKADFVQYIYMNEVYKKFHQKINFDFLKELEPVLNIFYKYTMFINKYSSSAPIQIENKESQDIQFVYIVMPLSIGDCVNVEKESEENYENKN